MIGNHFQLSNIARTALLAAVVVAFANANAFAQVTLITQGAGAFSCYPNQLAPGVSSSCFRLDVDCNGALRHAFVKQNDAPAGSTPVGNIIFTTGSYGTAVYSASGTERLNTVAVMRNNLYRTFEVAWETPDGWLNGTYGDGTYTTIGFKAAACALPEVAEWLKTNKMPQASDNICAQGNSLGGGQIAHHITSYGGDSFYKSVVYSGGPSTSLPYEICFGAPGQGLAGAQVGHDSTRVLLDKIAGGYSSAPATNYYNRCKKYLDPADPDYDATLGHGIAPNGPLADQFKFNALVSQGNPADYRDYDSFNGPMQTSQHIVVADSDSTGARYHADAYYNQLSATTSKSITYITASSPYYLFGDEYKHDIDTTRSGAMAIRSKLLNSCHQ